jgi:hypothetical protein
MSNSLLRILSTFCLLLPAVTLRAGEPDALTKGAFSTEERRKAVATPNAYKVDPASIKIKFLGAETGSSADLTDKVSVFPIQPAQHTVVPPPAAAVAGNPILNPALTHWQIVDRSVVVPGLDSKYAAALPKGVTDWKTLTGWKAAKSYAYELSADNLYGVQVVHVIYKVKFTPGGKQNNKGAYLTKVSFSTVTIDTSLGFRLSMTADAPAASMVNVGTAKNPVAAMQIKLSWAISSPVSSADGSSVYYMQGDGYYGVLGAPSKASPKSAGDVAPLRVPFITDPAKVF